MKDLNVEYLQLLSEIKPYIACIMNTTDIELIKLWLEKLNNEHIADKEARNNLLKCLGKQIKEGELQPPFNSQPPENLETHNREKSKFQAYHSPSFEVSACSKPKSKSKLKRKKTLREVSCKTSSDLSQIPNLPEDDSSNKWNNDFTPKTNFLTQICKHQKEMHSGSSWQDISSNFSDYDMASGDGRIMIEDGTKSYPIVNEKVEKLFRVIEHLRNENFILKKQLKDLDTRGDFGNNCEMQVIVNEVGNLKNKLNELLLLKSNLQSSQYSEETESQDAILTLNRKITFLHSKNEELRSTIQEMEEKLEDRSKNEEEVLQNCTILHKTQIETLRKRHKDELDKTHNAFGIELNRKLHEYNEKINEMKLWYERQVLETEKNLQRRHEEEIDSVQKSFKEELKQLCVKKENEYSSRVFSLEETKAYYKGQIEEIKEGFEKEINCKNEEIVRLEELLEEQCKRMQEEVAVIKEKLEKDDESVGLDETVLFLKKCITKMDKLYKKAEKKYESQLLRLKNEIQVRERHNQILLTTERVRLISTNSVMKQKQIDEIVGKLEQYYKQLLIEEHVKAMEDKKNDLRVISELQGKIALAKMYA